MSYKSSDKLQKTSASQIHLSNVWKHTSFKFVSYDLQIHKQLASIETELPD